MAGAEQRLYLGATTVLRRSIRQNVPVGAMASPREYVVVDHGEIRGRIAQTGERTEPSSVYSYPARNFGFIGLVPPEGTFLALLPNRQSMHQFAQGAQQIARYYGLADFMPIWATDPLQISRDLPPVDVFETILAETAPDVAEQIKRHYPTTAHFALIQHANTPEGEELQKRLLEQGIITYAAYGKKPYDYPNFGDRSGFATFAQKYGLPAPVAVVANTPDEVMASYEALTTQTGIGEAYMKLAGSGGGYGVRQVSSLEEVATITNEWNGFGMFGPIYPDGQIIPIEFQAGIPAIVGILSFQYSHGYITTPQRTPDSPAFTNQFISHGTDWIGNGYNVELEIPQEDRAVAEFVIKEFQRKFMHAAQTEAGEAWNYATGGVDFALIDLQELIKAQGIAAAKNLMRDMWEVVYDESTQRLISRYGPVIIEHNGFRESDAKPPAMFAEAIGIQQGIPFAAMKINEVNAHLPEVWKFLTEHGLNYDPAINPEGMIPFAWINDEEYGIHYGNVLIVAENIDRIMELRDEIIKLLQQAGLLK